MALPLPLPGLMMKIMSFLLPFSLFRTFPWVSVKVLKRDAHRDLAKGTQAAIMTPTPKTTKASAANMINDDDGFLLVVLLDYSDVERLQMEK